MGSLCVKDSSKTQTIRFTRNNNQPFKTNQIETTKYSLISFVPKSLILQFIRPANYVYLITAIAQSIPQISSLSPVTAIAPLIFVLGVALAKEGIQDYKRHKKDNQTNNSITHLLQHQSFVDCKWSEVCVGDIVKVKQGEIIPADILLLYSTEQNSICYVQTANLDGQNNLKTKSAYVDGIKLYPNLFERLQGHITVQKPNCNLHQFNGKITIEDYPPKQLSMDNLLVRGSILKNTAEAVGVVVYAGHDTKIMKNTGQINNKLSHVEVKVNKIQLVLLLSLIIISFGCSVGYYRYHTQYQSNSRKDFFYLIKYSNRGMFYDSFLIFLTSFLLLSFIIPVSMNVALEGIKIFLGIFVGFDNKMYYEPLQQYCSTLNMSIIEELGAVDYVLTDKTGTLTANQMKFQYAWINGYLCQAQTMSKQYGELIRNKQMNLIKVHQMKEQMHEVSDRDDRQFDRFWRAVVICHEVVVDVKKQQFQGSSPDEVCFVEYAHTIGYRFIKRTKNSIEISIKGQKIVYQLLNIIPFSVRKRMSVIVRDLTTKKIILYTKGADSSIIQKSNNYQQLKQLQQHLTQFSMKGLRTLVFSMREISEEQYVTWMKQTLNLQDSKLVENAQIIEIQNQSIKLTQSIESNLQIIGCSAIEDRLQDGVPQTIARLQQAGIIVMMITGDKLQTAENIGRLSNFIHGDAKVYRLRTNLDNIVGEIKKILHQIISTNIQQFSVVIEGGSIYQYLDLQDPQAVLLIKMCKSVIFCRSSPKQKASIVKWVKQRLKGIVLAIGDGGNDIGMIQQANIGVGIIGKQGNQAASSSDFYFGQFRFLDRLLMHHGRWVYYRMSYFFVYYGAKNLSMTLILFYFMINSAFSGFPAMSQPFITIYNTVTGLLLVSYYAVWQQDINSDTYPQCYQFQPLFYKQYKQLDLFSYKRYILWSMMAIGISVVVHFIFMLGMCNGNLIDEYGHTGDYNTYASGIALSLASSVILIVIMDMNNFTWFSAIVVILILTVLPSILFFIIENYVVLTNVNIQSAISNNSNLRYWSSVLLLIGLTIMVKIGWNAFLFVFHPTYIDKVMLMRSKAKQKKQLISTDIQLIVHK